MKTKVLISCANTVAADLRLCFCMCQSRFSFDATHKSLYKVHLKLSFYVNCVSFFLGLHERPEDFARTLYVARITNWEEDSKMAFG